MPLDNARPRPVDESSDERLLVMILPIEGQVDAAAVHVDGRVVGTIVKVSPEREWTCFDGSVKSGPRWLPAGVDPCVEGPERCADAAMLLLVLAGYEPRRVLASLGRAA